MYHLSKLSFLSNNQFLFLSLYTIHDISHFFQSLLVIGFISCIFSYSQSKSLSTLLIIDDSQSFITSSQFIS